MWALHLFNSPPPTCPPLTLCTVHHNSCLSVCLALFHMFVSLLVSKNQPVYQSTFLPITFTKILYLCFSFVLDIRRSDDAVYLSGRLFFVAPCEPPEGLGCFHQLDGGSARRRRERTSRSPERWPQRSNHSGTVVERDEEVFQLDASGRECFEGKLLDASVDHAYTKCLEREFGDELANVSPESMPRNTTVVLVHRKFFPN